jgi:hypothetical protein
MLSLECRTGTVSDNGVKVGLWENSLSAGHTAPAPLALIQLGRRCGLSAKKGLSSIPDALAAATLPPFHRMPGESDSPA